MADTSSVWDGVTINYDNLLADNGYAWYNSFITVGGSSYRLLHGYQVAGLREMDARLNSAAAVVDSVTASAATASDAAAAALSAAEQVTADKATVATDKGTVQGLKDLTETLKNSAAASALLAQQYIGTATNVVVPVINTRLASAWDATGAATAYALTNVVSVYRYDTRKDWDRGAWRKKSRQTSWYQETLNTAARGAKAEFPAVAALAAKATLLVAYDALDLDGNSSPRMWKPWTVAGLTCLAAGQGRIVYGGTGGLYVINLPAGSVERWDTSGRWRANQNVATYNQGTATWTLIGSSGIVSNTVSGVDLRVLPGAPLDPVSGLPIPTIAVATASGTSVIHPSGAVYNITTTGHDRVLFTSDNRLMTRLSADRRVEVGAIPYASAASNVWRSYVYSSSTAPAILGGTALPIDARAVASPNGLTLLAEDTANPNNGMTAFITTSYNTGWMAGDIRGAWLCDATTGSITGSGELVVNGAFDTDLSGWSITTAGAATAVWSGGAAVLTGDGTNAAIIDRSIATVVGQTYLLTFDVANNAAAYIIGTVQGGSQYINGASSVGPNRFQFTATSSITWLRFARTSAAGATTVDNVSVKLAVPDRCYKGKGINPTGTLNRAAVATGSDVVAFSGFSASNYLEQPYTSDQDAASADWEDTVIACTNANAAVETLLSRDSATTGARRQIKVTATGTVQYIVSDGTNTATVTSTQTVSDNVLRRISGKVRRATNLAELWIDGVRVATASISSVGSLSNASASLRIGLDQQGANPATTARICLVRTGAYASTQAQESKAANDERAILAAGAKALLGGTSNSVNTLSWDDDSASLLVGTGDGFDRFSGLRRVSHTAAAVGTAFTAASVAAISAGNGTVLIGTASEAGIVTEATYVKDELRAVFPDQTVPLVAEGVTTDATPLTMAPRLLIQEGETWSIEATITGREYGTAGAEFAHYRVSGTFRRLPGGNVTQVGNLYTVIVAETTASLDGTLAVDTTAQTVAAQVTGKAATRIEWRVTYSTNLIAAR